MLAAALAVGAADVDRFTHGTTVATNALLERKGAQTAFVATAGFEHMLHLRRQNRAHLYRLCAHHPEPLVPLERCFGVRERIGPDGVLEAVDLESLPEFEAEAVAVCLLFSFRDARTSGGRRRAAPALAGGARRRLARGRARVPRVRASLDRGRRRVPRARARRLPRARSAARARPGCPSRSCCGRQAASRRWRRRQPMHRGRSSPGRPAAWSARRKIAERGRVLRRDLVRHGRHVDRRLPDLGRCGGALDGADDRGPSDSASERRRPHGRRRRRLDRVGRRGRRAARRAGERRCRSRPGLLRARRQPADGDRRESPARAASDAAC